MASVGNQSVPIATEGVCPSCAFESKQSIAENNSEGLDKGITMTRNKALMFSAKRSTFLPVPFVDRMLAMFQKGTEGVANITAILGLTARLSPVPSANSFVTIVAAHNHYCVVWVPSDHLPIYVDYKDSWTDGHYTPITLGRVLSRFSNPTNLQLFMLSLNLQSHEHFETFCGYFSLLAVHLVAHCKVSPRVLEDILTRHGVTKYVPAWLIKCDELDKVVNFGEFITKLRPVPKVPYITRGNMQRALLENTDESTDSYLGPTTTVITLTVGPDINSTHTTIYIPTNMTDMAPGDLCAYHILGFYAALDAGNLQVGVQAEADKLANEEKRKQKKQRQRTKTANANRRLLFSG